VVKSSDSTAQGTKHPTLSGPGGCVTWSNLTTPGDYAVTEADANESNWFHSTSATSLIVFPSSGGSENRTFGMVAEPADLLHTAARFFAEDRNYQGED
jgi:hypothetical protein